MSCFRDFTVPLWKIFGGNLLMLVTIVFYITWWTIVFRPNRTVKKMWAGFFIALALLAGAAATMIMFSGIGLLFQAGKGFPVTSILLGAAVFYIILLAITRIAFQRTVTSELLLIIVWSALEISAIAVLQGDGRFSTGQALTLAALVILATGIGIICYILYYRLDEISRFWNGIIPLIVDAGVDTVFLVVLALS